MAAFGSKYDEKSKALYALMNTELLEGKLGRMFLEKHRIADPATSEAATEKFQQYMDGLTKRLLADDYDPQKHNFRFLIAQDDKPNAGILDFPNQPIVIFSSGMIARLQTEDQLAAFLAHELTHFSIASEKNSKLEELSADIWPVYALRRAGFNPKAGIGAMDAAGAQKDELDLSTLGGALSYIDPHPKTPMRKRAMENALFVLARDEGVADFDVKDTPANEEIKKVVAAAVHTSHIDRLKKAANYDGLTVAQQMEFIAGLIPDELGASLKFHTERREGVKKLLDDLPPEAVDEENEEQLGKLVDRILELKDDELSFSQRGFYDALATNLAVDHTSWQPAKLGPRLKRLHQQFGAFVWAKTAEDAEAAALKIKEDTRGFTFPGGQLMWGMQWPEFVIPPEEKLHRIWGTIDAEAAGKSGAEEAAIHDKHGVTARWEKQVQWALEKNSAPVAQALWAYGIKDPRLVAAFGKDLTAPKQWNQNNEKYDNLQYSQNGKIIGHSDSYRKNLEPDNSHKITPDYIKRITGFEERRIERLNHEAEKLLEEGVDWSLLEQGNDFSAFITRYRSVLEPQITVIDPKTPFADAFMEKVEELLAKNPGKYRPIVRQFFSATTYHPDLDRSFDRKGVEKPVLATIPDMVRDTTSVGSWKRGPNPTSVLGFQLNLAQSLTSGFARFVLDDKHNLFTPADKLEYLKNTRFMHIKHPELLGREPERPEIGEYVLDTDLRKIIGYDKPEIDAEFLAMLDKLQALQYPNPREQGKLIGIMYQQKWEAIDYLSSNTGYVGPAVMKSIADQTEMSYGSALPFEKGLRKLLDARMESNAEYELEKAPVLEFAKAYRVYAEKEMFARHPQTRVKYDRALSERLKNLSDPAEAKEITEMLLFGIRLDDPRLRQQVIQKWVDTQVAALGLDDETEAYKTRVGEIMEETLGKAKGFVSFDMMAALATGTQAQEKLSFFIRDRLKDALKDEALGGDGNWGGIFGEFGLAALAKHNDSRENLLEFLTAPLSDSGLKKMYLQLERMANDTKTQGRHAYMEFYRKMLGNLGYADATEEQKISALHLAHKNFWSLPLEGRTFFIEKVLFPPEKNDDEYLFRRSFNKVLDGIFPYGNKYSEMGRLITSAYLDNVPVYGQRVLLSALMVARESSALTHTEEDVGRTLALVLVNLGPAGVKLAQAIHSHPDTPEEIRNGMSDVKGRADLPFRWDIFSRMNDALPEAERGKIEHVGPLLGGGSFQYTLETLKKTGLKTALSLLRRNVKPRAETEFGHFAVTAEAVIVKHPELSPLREIIQQARDNVPVETDYAQGKVQADTAQALYKGAAVTLRGQKFTFSTVDWLGHGAEYKESSIAPGHDFNDLPTATEEDRKHKHDAAEAIVTAELYTILTGKAFDYDRHGSNLRVQGTSITGFDFGGMLLEAPTREEKQLLGKAIAEAYGDARRKKIPFGNALIASVSRHAADIKGSNYMASVERGLLALGDYLKLLDKRETENIVSAITETGRIDKDISQSVKKNMGLRDLSAIFLKSVFARKETGIVIHDPRYPQAPANTPANRPQQAA